MAENTKDTKQTANANEENPSSSTPERVTKELLDIVTQTSSVYTSKVPSTKSGDQVDGRLRTSNNDDQGNQSQQTDNEEYIRIMKK